MRRTLLGTVLYSAFYTCKAVAIAARAQPLALGIVVINCIIIQSYVLVNKEQQQCVEAVFSHGASKTTLYKVQ